MAKAVYVLCALTSVACAVMLFRGYMRTHARFLLWSSLCFVALMVNNLMLFIDLVLFPDVTIAWISAPARSAVALVGLASLLYGLICDVE